MGRNLLGTAHILSNRAGLELADLLVAFLVLYTRLFLNHKTLYDLITAPIRTHSIRLQEIEHRIYTLYIFQDLYRAIPT